MRASLHRMHEYFKRANEQFVALVVMDDVAERERRVQGWVLNWAILAKVANESTAEVLESLPAIVRLLPIALLIEAVARTLAPWNVPLLATEATDAIEALARAAEADNVARRTLTDGGNLVFPVAIAMDAAEGLGFPNPPAIPLLPPIVIPGNPVIVPVPVPVPTPVRRSAGGIGLAIVALAVLASMS